MKKLLTLLLAAHALAADLPLAEAPKPGLQTTTTGPLSLTFKPDGGDTVAVLPKDAKTEVLMGDEAGHQLLRNDFGLVGWAQAGGEGSDDFNPEQLKKREVKYKGQEEDTFSLWYDGALGQAREGIYHEDDDGKLQSGAHPTDSVFDYERIMETALQPNGPRFAVLCSSGMSDDYFCLWLPAAAIVGAESRKAPGIGGSGSINNDEDEIEDDDLLALLEGDEDAERSPKNTDKSDMYGKTLKTAVARVQNSGSVSGSITARAQQLKRPLNKNSYTPQFYDVSLITSGNGVSLFASTGRFAKNATRVALDNVNNDGHISGQIRQISGNNSGYNSPHMMSGSEATGSGNGISLYSDTFNAQIPRVETRLGKINNRGSIRGDAYLKAGDGSGDLSIDARASPAKA